VFGQTPHQVCQFHIIKDITGSGPSRGQAVLRAVSKERKRLTALVPKQPRGRPAKAHIAPRRATFALAGRIKRQQNKISDLFTDRHLFVRRSLTPAEQREFVRITRGLPHLRALRQKVALRGAIMDLVYGLFESGPLRGHRRCRVATAQAKLARLRNRISHFKNLHKTLQPLFSPNLEKALTFLDEGGRSRGHKLLPSTSNAVERSKSGPSRGHRRFRKMQASIYSVRTLASVKSRIALDMTRDEFAASRATTTRFLHVHRNSNRARQG